MAELKDLWERDFVPTSDRLWRPSTSSDPCHAAHLGGRPRLRPSVHGASGGSPDQRSGAGRPRVCSNKDNGLKVIAVGGDKLSRGLTLEGLTVSYFLRASRMYDTLMQMGRWFGYRQGYLDLCRLYITENAGSLVRAHH